MKKIITSAALFAASTALASAAFVSPTISWNDFSNVTPSANTTVSNSDSTGAIHFAAEKYVPTQSNGALVFDGTDDVAFFQGASGASINTSNSVGTFSFTTTSITLPTSGHSVLASIQTSGSNQIGIGVDSSGHVVATYTSNGTQYGSGTSTFTITASATNTFTFVLDSSSGLRVYVNGNDTGITGLSGLKYTSESTKQLTIGATTTPSLPTAMTVTNVYVHSTSLSAEDVKDTFKAGGLIPEPSAFGLLAGIGALALAVSRRRRSR